MASFKDVLRKVLPLRTSVFASARAEIAQELDHIKKGIAHSNRQSESLANRISVLEAEEKLTRNTAKELLWAETFNRSISDVSWLKGVSFSPGRWAVGYPFLYVLFRVLSTFKPQNIFELGLGESSKMIASYAAGESDVRHCVVEDDANWIDFFKTSAAGVNFNNTEIVRLDLEMIDHPASTAPVRSYLGFAESFAQKKFDLISIDGPIGADMHDIARIDILELLPGCLEDSFIIMIDDSNRSGEAKMISQVVEKLRQAKIETVTGIYQGEKELTLICSPDNAFYCTL